MQPIPTPSPESAVTQTSAPTLSPESVVTQTSVPTPSPESVVTQTSVSGTQDSANQQAVLYEDGFTDSTSGWPNELVFDNYYIGYHEPTYFHVEVHERDDRAVVVLPGQSFDDFTVEGDVLVSAANTASSGEFRYGLVIRRSGKRYYAFTVSPRSKTWSVLKSSPIGLEVLADGTDESIRGLDDIDTLRVDATESEFTFHINDRLIGQVSDSDYTSGEVGFFVETFDASRAHIHYDSLMVREVEMLPLGLCTVGTQALDLHYRPAFFSALPITVPAGTGLELLGRSPNASWIHVRIHGSDQQGWLVAHPAFVSCNVSVGDLPMSEPTPER